MENASKALLIAAGMLFAMLILALLIYGYNELIEIQQGKNKIITIEQITKFNKEYESYNREKVRGSDLLSLVNKIVDYNDQDADPNGDELYEPMLITINMGSDLSDFRFDDVYSGFNGVNRIDNVYTNTTGGVYNESKDNCNLLSEATGNIKNYGTSIYSPGKQLTDAQLQKLSKNIANFFDVHAYIVDTENYNAAVNKRANVIKEIFGINIADEDRIEFMEMAAYEYYQITQFKRANFECTNTRYNQNTGRIVELEFEFSGNFS